MNHNPIRALCLMGGEFHDFDQAAAYFGPELLALGVQPRFVRDQSGLESLSRADTDLVFIHCLLQDKLGEAVTDNLVNFVESGGGLFAAHGATASFLDNVTYHALLGAKFIEHGPRHDFQVTSMQRPHPVTAGVEAFTINDELYVHEYAADLHIQMVAAYLGKMQPVVWTRTPGAGRVCYSALGHDLAVWRQPPVRRLVANGINWSSKHA